VRVCSLSGQFFVTELLASSFAILANVGATGNSRAKMREIRINVNKKFLLLFTISVESAKLYSAESFKT